MTEQEAHGPVPGRKHPSSLPPPEPEDVARWCPRLPDADPRHRDAGDGPAAVWAGVVWSRLGRADIAWRWWDEVEDPALGPWVAAERGRVLRELGLHARARHVESDGLAAAIDLVDAVMLRLSIAADLVGLARLDLAEQVLDSGSTLLAELPDGPRVARQRLRQRWVEVELALARGEKRVPTVGLPSRGDDGPVFPGDHDAGTDFHRAKGLLFAGVVRQDRWFLEQAARLAPPMLLWAVELARLDAGEERAGDRAVAAWASVRPPADVAVAAAATPTALRLTDLA